MRITRKEQIKSYQIERWKKAFESLKFVKPFFNHDCFECNDKIINEKMWREYVYVHGDFTSSGHYSFFYLCQKCAINKLEAFRLFQGQDAYKWLIKGKYYITKKKKQNGELSLI